MNPTDLTWEANSAEASAARVFAGMHAASRAGIAVTRSLREDRLDRLKLLLRDNVEEFVAAIDTDFRHRSAHETRLLEMFPALDAVRHARRHVGTWMRPQRRRASIWFRPGRAEVIFQPLGVVGIIVPWNYPLLLAVSPLAAALAAGNRAMIKMSEYTPRTGWLLATLVSREFDESEVAVVLGGADIGAAFAKLPFDHLLFTGSTAVGHHIMHAAADNLTPVTLELGGKSPVIVGPDYTLAKAAERIMVGKLMNAGQTCIAPDYVLLPDGKEGAFLAAAREVVARLYPELASTPDYSAIIDDRHFQRLRGCLDDAASQGARLEPLSLASPDPATRRLPPVALLGVRDSMRIMREEIFGPLLPIVPYRSLADAITYVNARPRPLALYVFDNDRKNVDAVLNGTVAGGVTVNDTILHIAHEDLPFGGVGPSGMGHYHGYDGFKAFSKQKGVFRQSAVNAMSLFNPPYGRLVERLTRFLIR
jgi:acyl-CoA reductase-like NAD-dependent aldehyde dehydrogenase